MYLKKSKCNGRTFLSYVEGYRDHGKVRQRTIKKIGYVDDLIGRYEDPVAYFSAAAKSMKKSDLILSAQKDDSFSSYFQIPRAPILRLNHNSEEISIPSSPNSILVFMDEYKPRKISFTKEHWHHSLQFIIICYGNLEVSVNGTTYMLHKDEGIFINSNVLHCIDANGSCNCVAYTFHVPPSSICSEKEIYLYSKFVLPIISNGRFSHIIFHKNTEWHVSVVSLLYRALSVVKEHTFTYELEIKTIFTTVWITIQKNMGDLKGNSFHVPNSAIIKSLKMMLSFIYTNYSSKISLDDIAASAFISKTECNRCFNKVLHQSPVKYLNRYRISSVCRELASEEKNIEDIAYENGFSDYSYFNRTFRNLIGNTPTEYRISLKKGIAPSKLELNEN